MPQVLSSRHTEHAEQQVRFSYKFEETNLQAQEESMRIRDQLEKGLEPRSSACPAAGIASQPARRATSLRICSAILFLAVLCGTAVSQEQSDSGRIAGRILDSSGKPISNAAVVLTGGTEQHVTSDPAGAFEFSQVAAGRYRLTANGSGGAGAASVDVAPGRTAHVDLRLSQHTAANAGTQTTSLVGQAMQFADDPHFTVAGITDWTAAGGHGSDVNLRTSEALTRETLDLPPDNRPSTALVCPESEATVRANAANNPNSFEANHCLGIFYLRTGKYGDAVTSLKNAYHIRPSDAVNEYALAEAYEKGGDTASARDHFHTLSAQGNVSDLHRLAGSVDESLGDPVAAVTEFAQAARLHPSEQNYFSWGSELLYHRAVWQARDVFSEGVRAWPHSARMLTALGAALFAGALYDDAAERLCQAATLEPADPEPYLFMGRIEVVAPHPLPCVAQKLTQFHEREPGNALADYYLAMALTKQQQSPSGASANSSLQHRIDALLQQAVTADPACGEAWLELGNVQAQSGDYASAIPLYTKSVDAKPQLSEAYYRLGVAYDRTGQRDKAREAFAQHDRIERQQAAAVEEQRRAIKQFVISSSSPNAAGENPQH